MVQANLRNDADDERVIKDICALVNRITGIQLGDKQQGMVRSRLVKRLLDLNLESFTDYEYYLQEHQEAETGYLVSLLTTHHTFFFREFNQFEFLLNVGLKEIIEAVRRRPDKTLRVWSAACSRGQEVYSLAMFLHHHLAIIAPDVKFDILGTDVDTESVSIAKNGVYLWENLKEVPHTYMKDHWARGRGDIASYVKARDSLRKLCRFNTANLVNFRNTFNEPAFDVIFCRNVFIYFDGPTITQVTKNLMSNMHPHGMLFLGISETLNGLPLDIESLGLSSYRPKRASAALPTASGTVSSASNVMPLPTRTVPPPAVATRPLQVLCVDDSPSIHMVLKQILKPEFGFEIVATAVNGIDAAAKLKQHKVDVMTLDIHMPEQTGIEYLQKNFGPQHPPVVMLTSVAREDSELALNALNLGASDYVEKPSLQTLQEKGDEIRIKLKCAVQDRAPRHPISAVEKEFASKVQITRPERSIRVIVATPGEMNKLQQTLKELQGQQPATMVLFVGHDMALPHLTGKIQSLLHRTIQTWDEVTTPKANEIYTSFFDTSFVRLKDKCQDRQTALLVLGDKPQKVLDQLVCWSNAYTLAEDGTNSTFLASDRVPLTSFAYMSTVHLSKA